MNVTPSQLVRQYLIDEGLGFAQSTVAWYISIGLMTSSPDSIITITDTAPVYSGRTNPDGKLYLADGLQIRTRALAYPDAYKKADAIMRKLATLNRVSVTVSGETVVLQSFRYLSGPMYMGQEEQNRRVHFAINGTVTVNRV